MNRRELFATFAGVATLGLSVRPALKKYGCLTIDGHRHHLKTTGENLRVWVDGKEVFRCYEADDIEGYALAFCTDPESHTDWSKRGRYHIRGNGKACRLRLTGNVVIAPGAPLEGTT